MTDENGFRGLVALVQYREKKNGMYWHNMAAFDNMTIAEKYADDCGKSNSIFESRTVDLNPVVDEVDRAP